MPKAIQKLVRNGNSTGVSIPRTILHFIGWLPGQSVIVEVLEDKSLHVRLPCERDFGVQSPPRMLFDDAAAVVK